MPRQDDYDNPYESRAPRRRPSGRGDGDSTGGVIPYKNPPALIAYYLGLFSLLPGIGLLLAIPALILGIMGLKKRAENPEVKGSVHAWIGIVMGGLMTLIWGGAIAAFVFAAAAS